MQILEAKFFLNIILLQYVNLQYFFNQIWSKYTGSVGSSAKQKLCANETTKDAADIYLFGMNNRNFWRCEICSKVTIKALVSLLLTLSIFYTFF